jgi:hypothetical protein
MMEGCNLGDLGGLQSRFLDGLLKLVHASTIIDSNTIAELSLPLHLGGRFVDTTMPSFTTSHHIHLRSRNNI